MLLLTPTWCRARLAPTRRYFATVETAVPWTPPPLHPQRLSQGSAGEYVEHYEVSPDHNFVDDDWDAD